MSPNGAGGGAAAQQAPDPRNETAGADGSPVTATSGALRRIVSIGRPMTGRLVLAVLAGVAAAGSAVGLTATSAWLIARAAQRPPVLALMVAITAVQTFGIGRAAFRYAERLAAHDAAFRILGELRVHVYRHLERLAPAGLAAFRSGDLLARLVSDVDGLADLWLRLLLPYASALIVAAGATILVGWLAPLAGLALGITLAFVALVAPVLAGRYSRRAERAVAPARGELATATVDVLAGAPELLVAAAAGRAIDRIGRIDARLAAAERRAATGGATGTFLSGIGTGAAVWCALVAGVLAVRDGSLGGVGLAVVALTPIAAHEVVAGLVSAAQHLPGLAASAERVVDVLDRPEPVHEPDAPLPLPSGPYGLRVRGLAARYDPAGPDVLRALDLDVAPGTRLLVTGPSGSGKSTLAAVLLRFLDPSGGTVQLVAPGGPVDLTRLAAEDVRRVIGLCAQDAHVFDTSVRENVRLARPDADDEALRDALRRAQLGAWADSLPEGLDTRVGEHGARLSAGQRQRLALARTLLADPPVVIFDEPTEHLDEATAAALTADLLAATSGRTVIMITHRPELMEAADWSGMVDLGSRAPARSGKV